MISDNLYDVVIFEYYQRAREGLPTLARRLKERFPNAIFIFLLNWDPTMIRQCSDENCFGFECCDGQNVISWWKDNGFSSVQDNWNNPKMYDYFRVHSTGLNATAYWSWGKIIDPETRSIVFDTARDVGGYVLPMPKPKNARYVIVFFYYF